MSRPGGALGPPGKQWLAGHVPTWQWGWCWTVPSRTYPLVLYGLLGLVQDPLHLLYGHHLWMKSSRDAQQGKCQPWPRLCPHPHPLSSSKAREAGLPLALSQACLQRHCPKLPRPGTTLTAISKTGQNWKSFLGGDQTSPVCTQYSTSAGLMHAYPRPCSDTQRGSKPNLWP